MYELFLLSDQDRIYKYSIEKWEEISTFLKENMS